MKTEAGTIFFVSRACTVVLFLHGALVYAPALFGNDEARSQHNFLNRNTAVNSPVRATAHVADTCASLIFVLCVQIPTKDPSSHFCVSTP